ncbi:MAG: hypothetical protein V4687_07820 [Bacteroidota bacterium]
MTYKPTFLATICSALIVTALMSACSNEKKPVNTTPVDSNVIKNEEAGSATGKDGMTSDTTKVVFNVNTIPVTKKDIGSFPYLDAPKDYKYNDITKSDLKTVHFPVDGKLIAAEGKTYSTNIYKIQESEAPFNAQIVEREYTKTIKGLGGVQISSKLLPGQIEKIGKKRLEDEGDHAYTIVGANDYTLNHVNTYIIRTDKVVVWIELSFYQNGGYIYILENANN